MNMEEYKDCYFNYLANEIIDAIMNADGYDCKDFTALKLEMLVNLRKMLLSRERYNRAIELLREDDIKKRGR